MNKLPLVLGSTLMVAASAAPVSLVQNEYDFAAAVAKHGERDGFLMYLDKQAVGLTPNPTNDYDRYYKAKPSTDNSKLLWYPSYAIVAASGDFGIDTGPWTYEAVDKDGKTVHAYGEWLTVWHRNEGGEWKALFDGGTEHDAASTEKALAHDVQVTQLRPSSGPAATGEQVHDQLIQSERAFYKEAADHSLREAYRSYGAADLRLLLDQNLPVLGRDATVKAAADVPAGVVSEPMGGSTAKSGDLGYVYGETYRLGDAKRETPVGVYMHVWQHTAEGWRLLVAEDTPLRPAK